MSRINKLRQYLVCIVTILLSGYIASGQYQPAAYTAAYKYNYTKSWEAKAPEANPNTLTGRTLKDVLQTNEVVDALGRPVQSIIKSGSYPSGGAAADMVTAKEYDVLGREIYSFLSFGATAADGNFKLNPFQQQAAFYTAELAGQGDTYFYSQSDIDFSPNNRVTKTYPAGNSWVMAGRGKEQQFMTNLANDDVKNWNVSGTTYTVTGAYPANTLYEIHSIDESGKQLVEYKDKQGKIILRKHQNSATVGDSYSGWLCTYYLYDEWNNLRLVIQPAAVEQMVSGGWTLSATMQDEQCFRYEYDERNRKIISKDPGAGEKWFVYDVNNRLVMTQDAIQRGTKWIYFSYDNLNRAVTKGVIYDTHDRVYHANLAQGTAPATPYPNPALYTNDLLTQQQYDNYTWLTTYSVPTAITANRNTSYDSYFSTAYTLTPYPQPLTQAVNAGSLITGVRTAVIGSAQVLFTVNYYDDKGRIIQTQKTNSSGGIDITTTQYSFNNLPLTIVVKQEKAGTNPQTQVVVTKLEYDELWRLITIRKSISSTINGANVSKPEQVIVSYTYDKRGLQKIKTLAPGFNSGLGLEKLIADYNIRGWLIGVNREYLLPSPVDHMFGYEVGYDKPASSSGTTYTAAQYNGNSAGTIWKSKGDQIRRKFDYSYDYANRFDRANFVQNTTGTTWDNTLMNFGVEGFDADNGNKLKYDANGNLKMMIQRGWKPAGQGIVDAIHYNYVTGTNRLQQVVDDNNDEQSKMGDLHYTAATKTATDYTYDLAGNQTADKNKGITVITYNPLNLPASITIPLKGTINYVYDGAGIKLSKTTVDNSIAGKTVTRVTKYFGGFVYESRTTSPADPNNPDYTDQLQYIAHEEGRIRFEKATAITCSASNDRFVFDYFVKDQLGNTRMVLTEQAETDCYVAATVEPSRVANEKLYYDILDPRVTDKATTGATQASFETKLYRVNGSASEKTGLGFVVKVMVGDKIKITGESFYTLPGSGTVGGPLTMSVNDLLGAFAGSGAITGLKGASAAQVAALPNNTNLLTSFINSNAPPTNQAKAAVNWILFDDQMRFITGDFDPVQPGGGYKNHTKFTTPFTIGTSGYLYVYVSNESNLPVYFDNLNVSQTHGPVLEETHYYPFGLAISSLSSKAVRATYAQNKIQFGGKELQAREFGDGSGLDAYDFDARFYDAQIGRWNVIDPKAGEMRRWSTYSYAFDNPLRYIDPDGMSPGDPNFGELFGGYVQSLYGNPMAKTGPFANGNQSEQQKAFNYMVNLYKTGMDPYVQNILEIKEFVEGLVPFVDAFKEAKKGNYAMAAVFAVTDLAGGSIERAAAKEVGKIVEKQLIKKVEVEVFEKTVIETASNVTKDLPTQIHHFATNKSSTYTWQMEDIANKFGLGLDEAWNKMPLPHQGRHPNAYHNFVLAEMKKAEIAANGSASTFIEIFTENVIQPVVENPLLLRKAGW